MTISQSCKHSSTSHKVNVPSKFTNVNVEAMDPIVFANTYNSLVKKWADAGYEFKASKDSPYDLFYNGQRLGGLDWNTLTDAKTFADWWFGQKVAR